MLTIPNRQSITGSPNYKWWVLATIGVGTFMAVASNSSLIIALPSIASYFQADLPAVQWVILGETLTVSALLLPIGRLSDIVGRKRVYITGFAVFIAAAALASTASDLEILILAKVIQGAGSAMIQANGAAMVISVFPGNERGKALGSHSSVVGTGAIIGPALGGFLVSGLGWRWVFFINVPGVGGDSPIINHLGPQEVFARPRPGKPSKVRLVGIGVVGGRIAYDPTNADIGQPNRMGLCPHYFRHSIVWGPPCRLHLVGTAHRFANARLDAL